MENGLNAAIELSAETLSNVKLVQEKKLLQKYFEEIAQDTGKYCFMVKDTIKALEMSAIDILIVWDNLELNRIVTKNGSTNQEQVLFLTSKQEQDEKYFIDSESEVPLEIIDKQNIVDWLSENYKTFGVNLQIISDRTQEGNQFCKGFGGIGGILRWKVDFSGRQSFDSEDEFGDDFF